MPKGSGVFDLSFEELWGQVLQNLSDRTRARWNSSLEWFDKSLKRQPLKTRQIDDENSSSAASIRAAV